MRGDLDGRWDKSVGNTHKILVPTQAGNPGCAASGGILKRLPGCWGGSITNLLLTGIMPQPNRSPTSYQLKFTIQSTVSVDVETSGNAEVIDGISNC